MRKFLRAYKRALFLPIIPVVWLMISIIGVVGGPFGTNSLSLLARFLFWPATVGVAILTGAILRVLVREYMGIRRFWPEAPLIALLGSCVIAPFFEWMSLLLADVTHTVPSLIELFGYSFVVSMVISTFRHVLGAHPTPIISAIDTVEPKPAPPAPTPHPPTPHPPVKAPPQTAKPAAALAKAPKARILERLEPALRAPLVRLAVNDHYVDVVTEAGTESLLMRLADAISEAEAVGGLQVHRSHWVARGAIAGLMRERGKCTLVMRDGTLVPVSRTYSPDVQALDLPYLDGVSGA